MKGGYGPLSFRKLMNIPYNYIEASNEKDLFEKLLLLNATEGYAFKIINIYPKGKKLFAWYYASKRTQ